MTIELTIRSLLQDRRGKGRSARAGLSNGPSSSPAPGRRLRARSSRDYGSSWRLLAIFAPRSSVVSAARAGRRGGASGITALALSGAMTVKSAPRVCRSDCWLVLAAFMISRGMIKTGLGRRIAFHFIRAIGTLARPRLCAHLDRHAAAERCALERRGSGGIIFPSPKASPKLRVTAWAYGAQARRIPDGASLPVRCRSLRDVSDGAASNVLIAKFALQVTGIELTYSRWAIGAYFPD